MTKISAFLKKNVVLTVAAAAAIVSLFITPPCEAYYGYIDWSVIALLFCLMATVQGFRSVGVLDKAAGALMKRVKSPRKTAACLVLLCFFFSMLITNDVALITFVPLTIILFGKTPRNLMITVVLDTVAANLGSMLTPIGNPQNLFIYSHFNFTPADFILTMLPYWAVSLALVLISLLFIKNENGGDNKAPGFTAQFSLPRCIAYCVMLLCALLTVFRALDFRITLGVCALIMLVFDRRLFKKVDYSLLLTFICFFVFVGNISQLGGVKDALTQSVSGNEFFFGLALSQVISNVPCAIMLSSFTDSASELLAGVNVGGLGTLVASLASLISFKFYCSYEKADRKHYFLVFTFFNIAFMALQILLHFALKCSALY